MFRGKKALITGPFGQDGSYFCELLAKKNYEIHGIVRENLSEHSKKIRDFINTRGISVQCHNVGLYDSNSLRSIIKELKPDEIYHLAATHFSSQALDRASDNESYTRNVLATFNLLSTINDFSRESKVVVAGSCLMFEGSETSPQNEATEFRPISLYALGKIAENDIVKFFRHKGMHVSMAILYNHESPRRPNSFVTKKIARNMVMLSQGEIDHFELGDITAQKDWGYAKDYVCGMWLMAQQTSPADFILATGQSRTIKDILDHTSSYLDLGDWESRVVVNEDLIGRKFDSQLIGDPTLAKEKLNWDHTVSFDELIDIILESELKQEFV